ncbi:DUF3306 domain-containing protein [Pistricoccus aurantiacus]|uniref:DUF3306 domain-containing protein n=1 Tax=Pistricoccus aurantiacus TaxID=1883414 RepID=A0A5B8STK1_9GAMM|nr:DUF3306 domain-containing protein [Pistricoccus aurantiacus]QEA40006.1 DUF3306 domain-containing protein [Pistricoccus aurantiacus]
MSRLSRWSRRKRGEPTDTPSASTHGIASEDPIFEDTAFEQSAFESGSLENNLPEKGLPEKSAQVGPLDDQADDSISLDETLPDPESLEAGSDFSAYLQQGVSQGLRRRALRRLFATGGYNVRDGLDDYDQDFRQQKPLSAEISARLRQWTQKLEEASESPPLEEEPFVVESKAENDSQNPKPEQELEFTETSVDQDFEAR